MPVSEISKVYEIRLLRYRNLKNRVCGKDSISLTNVTCPTLLDSFNASDYRKAYFDNSKNDEECTTSCREQCEYMKYETLVSNSLFPTETYSEILFKNGNISV